MTSNDCSSFFQRLPFVRKIYSLEFSMYFFLLYPFFICAYQLSFHTTFTLSVLVAFSEYGGNPRAQRATHS